MELKFLRALIKGKLGNAAISIIDKNRGTNWAGEHAMLIDPDFLAHFKGIDPEKVLFITGTNGKSTVRIEFDCADDYSEPIAINCDGQVTMNADTKSTVIIRQHHIPLTLIHPEGYDYYGVLRQKLSWGQNIV